MAVRCFGSTEYLRPPGGRLRLNGLADYHCNRRFRFRLGKIIKYFMRRSESTCVRPSGRLCAVCPWRFIVFSFPPAFVAMPPRGPEDLAEPGWLIRPFDREDVRELQILIGMCVFEQLPRANAQGEREKISDYEIPPC